MSILSKILDLVKGPPDTLPSPIVQPYRMPHKPVRNDIPSPTALQTFISTRETPSPVPPAGDVNLSSSSQTPLVSAMIVPVSGGGYSPLPTGYPSNVFHSGFVSSWCTRTGQYVDDSS